MMVGDTDHDIVAGRRAGLSTCAVGWSELPPERLAAARPDHHVSHFFQVVDLALSMAGGQGSC
jgi:phosphoglycolate phosphatase-like HAD superfamily hydrolase